MNKTQFETPVLSVFEFGSGRRILSSIFIFMATKTTTVQFQTQPQQMQHSNSHSRQVRSEAESPPYASPAFSLDSHSPDNNSKAIVAVDKQTQCSPSPLGVQGGGGDADDGKNGRSRSRSRSSGPIKKVMLWARLVQVAMCMSSFAVMAADKTQGWSGDSFDRYREYSFCLVVNVMGFVYSGFQGYNSAYHVIAGKHLISHHLRSHFDFYIDQIMSYLLISASSAAATRVDDWVTNWGKDEFTQMATASIALSFLAFLAFALTSLLSGYTLWTRDFI